MNSTRCIFLFANNCVIRAARQQIHSYYLAAAAWLRIYLKPTLCLAEADGAQWPGRPSWQASYALHRLLYEPQH